MKLRQKCVTQCIMDFVSSMISTTCLLCNCISTHLSLSPDLVKVMVHQFLTDHCYTQGNHEREKKESKEFLGKVQLQNCLNDAKQVVLDSCVSEKAGVKWKYEQIV